MCWGLGILISSGVVRACLNIEGNLAWKLPFYLQWVWPVPLFFVAYFAPESPWNAVRRGKLELAKTSLRRLASDDGDREGEIEASLAYIQHTTALEKAETGGASILECFKGTNLRRTEIVRHLFVACLSLHSNLFTELRCLGRPNPLRKRHSRLRRRLPPSRRLVSSPIIQP